MIVQFIHFNDMYNSDSLHKEYTQLYDHFFASHAVVISAPLTMRWASIGMMEKDQIPTVISQLPLRVYLGVHACQEPGVEFGVVNFFSLTTQKFEEVVGDQREHKLKELAQVLLQKK